MLCKAAMSRTGFQWLSNELKKSVTDAEELISELVD
jgi:hypothetical protein